MRRLILRLLIVTIINFQWVPQIDKINLYPSTPNHSYISAIIKTLSPLPNQIQKKLDLHHLKCNPMRHSISKTKEIILWANQSRSQNRPRRNIIYLKNSNLNSIIYELRNGNNDVRIKMINHHILRKFDNLMNLSSKVFLYIVKPVICLSIREWWEEIINVTTNAIYPPTSRS
jgi:hypothetical protein